MVKPAGAFNNNFLNMADDLQIQNGNDISPNSLLKNAYQNDFSQMNIIAVTEGEIQSIICSLKSKDSSGYDGVSTQILKMCKTLIKKPPFSFVINLFRLVFFLTILNMQL